MNRVRGNHSAYTGCRINLAVSSDHSSGVQHAVASDFDKIAERRTDFFTVRRDMLVTIFDYDQRLVALNIGSNRTCTHMGLISQYGISDIIKMRNLNTVEEHCVLQFAGVADNSVFSYKRIASDKGTLTYLRAVINDARPLDIS